jgi:hypothetical protein
VGGEARNSEEVDDPAKLRSGRRRAAAAAAGRAEGECAGCRTGFVGRRGDVQRRVADVDVVPDLGEPEVTCVGADVDQLRRHQAQRGRRIVAAIARQNGVSNASARSSREERPDGGQVGVLLLQVRGVRAVLELHHAGSGDALPQRLGARR